MFICTGNICRSPLAHAVFENLILHEGLNHLIAVESSGTDAWHVGEWADERMQQTASKHGLEMYHRSRKLLASDLDNYNLLLTMDHNNYQNTLALVSNNTHKKKIRMFRDFDPDGPGDVPDPWYGGPEGFETVWTIVERTCRALLDYVRREATIAQE